MGNAEFDVMQAHALIVLCGYPRLVIDFGSSRLEVTLVPFVDSFDLEFGRLPGPVLLTVANELAGCQVTQ